ncbi:hypothetical protein FOPG_17851 [Fusarium oxysporum f. sp. conglutinans race 2 54008]|uniref:Uncharacterized protein n=1 Tax=Fusarium oxysporum f. sp. conglutinans race 2 54008 TaxID=1089457 RepID=X0H1K9_FUSOX|nr:hypothetical protein FOPG_17851 [Fusarium oxysporum f. sp. conglutinans race 2 54008]
MASADVPTTRGRIVAIPISAFARTRTRTRI